METFVKVVCIFSVIAFVLAGLEFWVIWNIRIDKRRRVRERLAEIDPHRRPEGFPNTLGEYVDSEEQREQA